MKHKPYFFCAIIVCVMILSGCEKGATQPNPAISPLPSGGADSGEAAIYHKMAQEDAKQIMDSGVDYILLDVRSQEEYDEKHIAGACLIPVNEMYDRAQSELPDKNALILVYCRSGIRSQNASAILVELGYTDVQDIGGINTWPYDTNSR